MTTMPLFERDSDQSHVPDGFVAYRLRIWTTVIEALVDRVYLGENQLPGLSIIDQSEQRLPEYPGEESRIFVRADSPIDERVFELHAEPIPKTLAECHPRYPTFVNLGKQRSQKA